MRRAHVGIVLGVAALSGAALAYPFPAVLRIPRRAPASSPGVPRATFSHRSHETFGCYACHPSAFPQAPLAFDHADMREGRFCGLCHDGHVAFAIAGAACSGCHAK